MSVLTLHKNKSTAACKTIQDVLAEVFGDDQRSETPIPGIASLPKDRRNKVLMLRRQLAHGTYNIDERLDAVLDRVFTHVKP
jgi:hypothetical protein